MAGGHTSYIYLGRGLTDKKITPEMILAYESPADFVGGGTIVLFGDGHVEYQDKGFVAKMVRHAKTGLLPVTMPSTMPGN
jgi:prepilin-type processing-associated H-X9-DG protein